MCQSMVPFITVHRDTKMAFYSQASSKLHNSGQVSSVVSIPTTTRWEKLVIYWSFQNVFALDFGLFQSSNTQLKGSQIPVTYGL